MTVIRVMLAPAPTDVLAHLVDHGPMEPGDLIVRVPPRDATAPAIAVGRALRLLLDMGLVSHDNGQWFATADGAHAVAEARR